MSVELKDERVRVFWLTRKLLNQAIPQVIELLNTQVSKLQEGMGDQAAYQSGMQQLQQQAAVGSLKKQQKVAAPEAQTGELVTGMQIGMRENCIFIGLLQQRKLCLGVPFAANDLRQWLAILHSAYKQAGWQESFWPDWIAVSGSAVRARMH